MYYGTLAISEELKVAFMENKFLRINTFVEKVMDRKIFEIVLLL